MQILDSSLEVLFEVLHVVWIWIDKVDTFILLTVPIQSITCILN